MARRASAKKPTTDNFTAGVSDDEPSADVNVVATSPEPTLPPQPAPAPSPTFAMSDDPAVPEQFLRVPQSPRPQDGSAMPPATPDPLNTGQPPVASGALVYEHRIRVLEAFHYPGTYVGAPDWVSRDWLAYAEPDPARGLPAGPCLNVPTPRSPTGVAVCRKGDFIVRQEILLAAGLDPEIQVEVWPREEFERLFIPARLPDPASLKEVIA